MHPLIGGGRTPYLESDENAPPSEAVLQAIATAENTDPTRLPPIYAVVDPDALDELFRRSTTGRVEFVYVGYRVIVEADGSVDVERVEEPRE